MAVHTIGCTFGLAAANPAAVDYATERLEQGHRRLREQLKVLETRAKQMKDIQEPVNKLQALRGLMKQTAAFVAALNRHIKWEEEELFPFLLAYHHRQSAPSIRPSFWVLENDYQLAMLFIQSFQEGAAQASAQAGQQSAGKPMEEAVVNLIQACLMLKDHLTMEDQVVLPLTEKVLTDLDYFFS